MTLLLIAGITYLEDVRDKGNNTIINQSFKYNKNINNEQKTLYEVLIGTIGYNTKIQKKILIKKP